MADSMLKRKRTEEIKENENGEAGTTCPTKRPTCSEGNDTSEDSHSLSITDVQSAATTMGREAGIVDFRDPSTYREGHIRGSTNIPIGDVDKRCFELPPRDTPFVSVCDTRDIETVSAFLKRGRWEYQLAATSPSDWNRLGDDDLQKGDESRRLWSPSPLLEDVIDKIEDLLQESDSRCALDIGCGAGRDVIFLATRSWHVTGLDNLQLQLDRCQAFCERDGCADRCKFDLVDLRNPGALDPYRSAFHLVHVARYLNRDIMEDLAKCCKKGGFIVFHTFMEGCKKPKSPKHLLNNGELAQTFGQYGFTPILDEVRTISDGRPLSFFAARKECD